MGDATIPATIPAKMQRLVDETAHPRPIHGPTASCAGLTTLAVPLYRRASRRLVQPSRGPGTAARIYIVGYDIRPRCPLF